MKIVPLAADSMGTRSMATFLQTKDCKILIDPAVSLCPHRYGLDPHPLEIQRRDQHWEAIRAHALLADILIVTHYHYDHHNPREPDLYKDKIVLIKHPTEKINFSQKRRAWYFLKVIQHLPKELYHSDTNEFTFGNTKIRFSPPVFHGPSNRLGYVTQIAIKENKGCFLFTSDVQGPCLREQTDFILTEDPDILYADGSLSYMLDRGYPEGALKESIQNLRAIVERTKVKRFILDHHLLRDLEWKERVKEILHLAREKGVEVITAAEFVGRENELLEARRKELYEKFPCN